MAAIESSEPGEKPGTCCQDTLKPSVCALPLFPTAEGPVSRYPTPHLTLGSTSPGKEEAAFPVQDYQAVGNS